MQIRRLCVFACLSVVLCAGRETRAQASTDSQGYAVDTAVFTSGDKDPIMRTTTVFLGDRAYDVVHGSPAKWACFDFENERIHLVSPALNKQSVVSFAQVLEFQSQLRALAIKRGGLAGFLAEPTFIHEFDANRSTIKLSSPWLVYEASVEVAAFDQVERFVKFADWSARAAGMLHPSAPPASARVAFNKALKKQNWLPTRITRSAGPRARTFGVMRSEQAYRHDLSKDDRVLISDIEKKLEEFVTVSFSEFRDLQNPPRKITKK